MRSINLQKTLGINASEEVYPNEHLVEYINLKLAAITARAG